ncbi:MAG: hypothetical protein MMC33_008465, partial [Icmadophila ericetorum]|nr:hypothetical protein [Icmadophila ericetorum]
ATAQAAAAGGDHLLIVQLDDGRADGVRRVAGALALDAPEQLPHGAVVDAGVLLGPLHRGMASYWQAPSPVSITLPCESQRRQVFDKVLKHKLFRGQLAKLCNHAISVPVKVRDLQGGKHRCFCAAPVWP